MRQTRGFTLLELATVIVIVGILTAMILPGFGYLRSRAERSKCASNLVNLFTAVSLHLQEQGSWPQVDSKTMGKPEFGDSWVDALSRYGVSPLVWTCPSVQRQLNDPNVAERGKHRLDYFATPFGTDRSLPYKHARQPWFVERADMHGEGQLVIFANGNVKTLRDVLRDAKLQQAD